MKKILLIFVLGVVGCGDTTTPVVSNNANNQNNDSNNSNNQSSNNDNNSNSNNTSNQTNNGTNSTSNNATNNQSNNEIPTDLRLRCRSEVTRDVGDNTINTYFYDPFGKQLYEKYLVIGKPEESEEVFWTYEDGLWVKFEGDTGLDGTIDYVTTFEYDENRILSREEFVEVGGRRVLKVFENNGDETLQRSDFNDDGIFEQQLFIRYYDRATYMYSFRERRNVDGTPTFRETQTFDVQGRVLTYVGENLSAPAFRRAYYTYEGDTRTYELDINGDGVIDEIEIRLFGPFGLLESTTRTANGDLKSQQFHEYEDDGGAVRIRYDSNGDGVFEVNVVENYANSCPQPE